MALIIRGKTKCPVCSEVLREEDAIVSFPALFSKGHKYSFCSDAAFHAGCFSEWEHSDSALSVYQEYLELQKERPAIPPGMELSEFQNTIPYIEFVTRIEQLLGRC